MLTGVSCYCQSFSVSLGHEVTLFASGDSRTRGKLHPVWPRALRLGRPAADPAVACTALLEAIAQRVEDFDVVHSHIDWLHLPLFSRLGVPFLTTIGIRVGISGPLAANNGIPHPCWRSFGLRRLIAWHGLPITKISCASMVDLEMDKLANPLIFERFHRHLGSAILRSQATA